MLKHVFYAVGLGITLFLLYLLQYTGAFKSVVVQQDERGPYTAIYKAHVGPYHKIVANIEEVEKWAKEHGLKCRLSFGEYLDDPSIVEEGRLNSRGGCLIDPLAEEERKILESLQSQLPEGFEVMEIPQTKAVVAIFSGAPGIGPLKVYPKAEEYIKENRLQKKSSVIEIYEIFDQKSMQTTYIWPIL